GESHEIEGYGRRLVEGRLQTACITRQPTERAPDRLVTALATNIDRHRPMNRMADPAAVQRGEQIAAVRIAEEGLVLSLVAHRLDRPRSKSVRAVSSLGEPHGIESRIVRAIKQRLEADLVASREVPFLHEALRVELQCQLGELRSRQGPNPLGNVAGNRRRRRTNGDTAHASWHARDSTGSPRAERCPSPVRPEPVEGRPGAPWLPKRGRSNSHSRR